MILSARGSDSESILNFTVTSQRHHQCSSHGQLNTLYNLKLSDREALRTQTAASSPYLPNDNTEIRRLRTVLLQTSGTSWWVSHRKLI